MDHYQVCSNYAPGAKNVLPLHTSLNPRGTKVFSFSVSVELNENEAENTMQANILPFYTSTAPDGVKRSKHVFSEVGHVAYQTKGRLVEHYASLILCTPLGKKVRH